MADELKPQEAGDDTYLKEVLQSTTRTTTRTY